MLSNKRSFAHALSYGVTGIGLVVLTAVPTALAGAAILGGPSTTATVHSKTVNVDGESCKMYPLTSSGKVQGFVDAAEAAQKTRESVCLTPGLKLTVSTALTVTEPAVLDFNGAIVTKAAGMNGWVVSVSSPGVSMLDVTLDGNRSAGAQGGGLLCEGAGCQASSVHVIGMTTDGIQVNGAGSSLSMSHSSMSGTISPNPRRYSDGEPSGDGIMADNGALLHVASTSATGNTGSGFTVVGAAAGSSISGSSSDNGEAGLSVLNQKGLTIGSFDSSADWQYGIVMWTSSNVKATSMTVTSTGAAEGGRPLNGDGSSIALFGISGSTFTTLHISGMPGYGLNLSGATKNTFGNVQVSRSGKGGSNPAVNLDHGTADNAFATVSVTGTTVGVDIGSGGSSGDPSSRVGNTGNTFTTLSLLGNNYAGINISGGSHNVFKTVNATDVGSGYPAPDQADIRLNDSTASYNTVDMYNTFINSSFPWWDMPEYVVYADTAANHNAVHLGTVQAGGYSVAKWYDANGTNTFG